MNLVEKVAYEMSSDIDVFYGNESRCEILKFLFKAFLPRTRYMFAIFIHHISLLIKPSFCILVKLDGFVNQANPSLFRFCSSTQTSTLS